MTYFEFLLLFLVVPIAGLLMLLFPLVKNNFPRLVWAIGLQIIAALIYTTPWDNYLVYKGIWNYGADRIVGTIGYVPIEEYLFFVVQPIFTGLLTLGFLRRQSLALGRPALFQSPRAVGFFVALTCLGTAALFKDHTLYLGLILAWCSPVLAFHWVIGGPILKKLWLPLTKALLLSTAYLWFCDMIALQEGIWHISEEYTTGLFLRNLPLEEGLFFLMTNVLVIQGVALFLYDEGLKPLEIWIGQIEKFSPLAERR